MYYKVIHVGVLVVQLHRQVYLQRLPLLQDADFPFASELPRSEFCDGVKPAGR
jgi:hypothetical protein